MKLTRRQLYDYRDPTPQEMKLTRAVHHLWRLRANLVRSGASIVPLEQALEILFQAKREVKAEIKARSAESFRKWRDRA